MPTQPIPPEMRFWRKVTKAGPDECWPWTGGVQGKGYGQFYRSHLRPVGAHRFSWELAHGQPVPDGMQVMHSCDNPPCVNPRHLSVGTNQDNRVDCSTKGRNPGNRSPDRSYVPCRFTAPEIAALRSQGMTYRKIGERLNISPATALRTLRRG